MGMVFWRYMEICDQTFRVKALIPQRKTSKQMIYLKNTFLSGSDKGPRLETL